MIKSYNDHAANERTFLAWVRTALSTVALGIVVKKGSLLAVLITGVSASAPDYVSEYGGAALVGTGIAAMAVSAFRFVRTARRIDDQSVHTAGIIRLASALSRRHGKSGAAGAASNRKRNRLLSGIKRIDLRLVGGTDVG